MNASWAGEEIFAELVDTGLRRGVKIRIAENKPSKINPGRDTEALQKVGAAEVRSLDFDKLFGSGVLHTKFWIVDDVHLYIGSANMDYRALTEVRRCSPHILAYPYL